MISNRKRNNIYRNYILDVKNNLNDMFMSLMDLKSSCSISTDFINQFLIFQKSVEKISKKTAMCTNFRPVFDIACEIAAKRHEMISDINKIEKFCTNFKNCPVAVKNYRYDFKKICNDYRIILKNIDSVYNMNVFFLKFIIRYNEFSVLLSKNVLKYRICPQLRLISEYFVVLGQKENIKIKDILKSIN